MSEVLALVSVEQADEILAAQIGVFQLCAKHTETPLDDQVLAFLQSNAEARQWALGLLGLESDAVQQMTVQSVPVGVIAAASASGISWLEILGLIQKYGPQIKQAFEVLKVLIALFKGVTPTGDPVSTPNF